MFGHVGGLTAVYVRTSQRELLSEYAKSLDLLTISAEPQLQIENMHLKAQTADIELLRKGYLDMKVMKDELEKQKKQWEEQKTHLETLERDHRFWQAIESYYSPFGVVYERILDKMSAPGEEGKRFTEMIRSLPALNNKE